MDCEGTSWENRAGECSGEGESFYRVITPCDWGMSILVSPYCVDFTIITIQYEENFIQPSSVFNLGNAIFRFNTLFTTINV